MGEGLKRAVAATTRTRRPMSTEMVKFLEELAKRGGPVAFATMGEWATFADSRARQAAKRLGYVLRAKDARDRHAWLITPAGSEALALARQGAGTA